MEVLKSLEKDLKSRKMSLNREFHASIGVICTQEIIHWRSTIGILLVFNKGVQGARKLLLKRVLVNTKIVKIHDPTILPLKEVVLESDR